MYITTAHFAAPTKGESNYKAVAEIKAHSVRLNEDLGSKHGGVTRQRHCATSKQTTISHHALLKHNYFLRPNILNPDLILDKGKIAKT
jgi:hypothetical protein